MNGKKTAALIMAVMMVLSANPMGFGILARSWNEYGAEASPAPKYLALDNRGSPISAPMLDAAADIMDAVLTYADGSALGSNALVSFGDLLKLRYEFSLSAEQSADIYAAMQGGSVTYEIPIPAGLVWPQSIAMAEPKAGGEKFAEIWAEDYTAYIKFTGDFWDDGGSAITDGWLEMQCMLDSAAIGGDDESVTIHLTSLISIDIRIAENQATEHTLAKSGRYADNRFQWTASYTPGTKAADYPLTLQDTFDNTVHTFVPGTLQINGVPVVDEGDFVTDDGSITEISYEITEANKSQAVTLTYQTRLADDQLKAGAPADTNAQNTISLRDDNGGDVVTPVTESITVGEEHKQWMSKTGVQNSRNIIWTLHINTLDRDLTDLTMYDAIPGWLEAPTGVTVTTQSGAAVDSGEYEFSSDAGDQVDNSTFCIKFTQPPYDPAGYTVTYTTRIKDAYFDDPTLARIGNNEAWLTYDWIYYDGTGSARIRTAPSVDIEFGALTNVIKKTAIGYDRSTHTITWKVELNPYGVTIDSGTITDALSTFGQTYAGGFSSTDALITTASAVGDPTLTVSVGALGTNAASFTFEAFVTNPSDYAGNHNGRKYDNTVGLDGTLSGGSTINDSASASVTVTSQMLAKRSLGYAFDTQEITWELTVNQNKMPMTNPTIVDTLPAGLRYVDASVTASEGTVSAAANGQTLTITLADTSDTVTVTYKTKVDTDAIAAFKDSGIVTIQNSAVLSHDGHNGLASDTASQQIPNKFLHKSGTYSDGVITFAVGLNANGVTIPAGITLTDTLSPGLRLDVTSVALWNAAVDAAGTLTKAGGSPLYAYDAKTGTPAVLVFDYSELLSDNKFSFPLPQDNGCYMLTYDCFVTGTGPYDNNVSLSAGGFTGDPASDSYTASIGAGGGGSSSKAAKIIVVKTDSRRPGVKLDGVTFELYQRFDGGVLPDMKVAEVTTGADGIAEFYPLTLNTTYVLKEAAAKAGYDAGTIAVADVPANVTVYKTAPNDDELVIAVSARGDYTLTAANVPADTTLQSGGIQFMKRSDKDAAGVFTAVGAGAAAFRITDQTPGSSFTMTAQTDGNGLVTFEDVPFGTYTVSETKTPAYHTKAADFTVTVHTDGTTSDGYGLAGTPNTVDNVYFRPSLTVRKQNAGGSAAVSGIAFELYEADGTTLIETKATDTSGKLTFATPLYGGSSYVVKEQTQRSGFYQSGVYTINNVNTGNAITVNWNNYAHAASLAVTKTDSMRPGVKLENAVLALYKTEADAQQDQNRVGTQTTDANGAATFTGLPLTQGTVSGIGAPALLATTFWLKEITAPAGYTASPTPIEITFPAGSAYNAVLPRTVSNAPLTADLTFTKYSKKNNDPPVALAGAAFTLTDQTTDSAFAMTAVSDQGGVVTFTGVPFGHYTVTETAVPVNHTAYPDFTVIIDHTGVITKFDGKDNPASGDFILVNVVKTTGLTIEKSDGAGVMQGVAFTLAREVNSSWQHIDTKTTGSDGKAAFADLLVGDRYKITETAPGEYYQPQDYIFTAEDIPGHSFRWINEPVDGEITVTKTDAVSGLPLEGVQYGLFDAGTKLAEAATDSSGAAKFTKLKLSYTYSMNASGEYTISLSDKTYTVRELAALDGYGRDTADHAVTLTPGAKAQSLTLSNQPVQADILFTKANSWDIPLANAVFTLTGAQRADGSRYTDSAVSGADGVVRFEDVPFGTYTVAETTAPADHAPNTQVFTVEIGKNGGFVRSMPAKVINDFDSFSLTITKTDANTGGPIAGVVYEIYDSGGIKRGTATTDGSGMAVFSALMVNADYEIREAAPPGYYPSAPFTFSATTNNESISWAGYPGVGQIALAVTDKNTGKPLGGIGYGIYDENDRLIATAVTAADGTISFLQLPLETTAMATYHTPPVYDPDSDTTFTIREIANIPGYSPSGALAITLPNNNPSAAEQMTKTPTPRAVTPPGGGSGTGGGFGGNTPAENNPEDGGWEGVVPAPSDAGGDESNAEAPDHQDAFGGVTPGESEKPGDGGNNFSNGTAQSTPGPDDKINPKTGNRSNAGFLWYVWIAILLAAGGVTGVIISRKRKKIW